MRLASELAMIEGTSSEAAESDFYQTMRIAIPPELLESFQAVQGKRGGATAAAGMTPRKKDTQPIPNDILQAFIGAMYDGVVLTDLDGRIDVANERIQQFLGYRENELKGRVISDLISGSDNDMIPMIMQILRNNRHVLIQAYFCRKDGTIFPAEITANLLLPEKKKLCLFIRDTTVRKQSEEVLRTAYEAIRNSTSGIAMADVEGRIVYVNPATARIWHYQSADEMTGMPIEELWLDHEAVHDIKQTVLRDQQPWTGVLTAMRADTGTVAVQVAASCNYNTDDEPAGMILSLLDISDRIRAEHAQREAESREAMVASLAAACHHIGQPATVLLASLNLLQHQLRECPDAITDLLENMSQAAEEIADVLAKMRTACYYRTTTYLEDAEHSRTHVGNRILDLENCGG